VLNFGMSFVLKGVEHPAKISGKVMIDGIFQINIPGRSFQFVTKCKVIHSISFGELYDIRGVPDNNHILVMSFNNGYPCELHAQNEAERATVDRILQDILRRSDIVVDDKIRGNTIQKQAWVKKKGKVIATKRLLHLNYGRRSLVIYKGDGEDMLPSYHILLHHRVTLVPRQAKCIQIVGTYKNIFVKFSTKELRNEWLESMQMLKEPAPKFDNNPPMFERHTNFMPDNSIKRYPQPHMALARAGPSAD